ncbi:MAG: hypothetical protein JW940_02665 [Polyangiaceae bacterium]|nr:hypothetical protein [Polyangiaceae bacterium]
METKLLCKRHLHARLAGKPGDAYAPYPTGAGEAGISQIHTADGDFALGSPCCECAPVARVERSAPASTPKLINRVPASVMLTADQRLARAARGEPIPRPETADARLASLAKGEVWK